eukprot:5200213-Pleurochrysis_carterae.AAC.1
MPKRRKLAHLPQSGVHLGASSRDAHEGEVSSMAHAQGDERADGSPPDSSGASAYAGAMDCSGSPEAAASSENLARRPASQRQRRLTSRMQERLLLHVPRARKGEAKANATLAKLAKQAASTLGAAPVVAAGSVGTAAKAATLEGKPASGAGAASAGVDGDVWVVQELVSLSRRGASGVAPSGVGVSGGDGAGDGGGDGGGDRAGTGTGGAAPEAGGGRGGRGRGGRGGRGRGRGRGRKRGGWRGGWRGGARGGGRGGARGGGRGGAGRGGGEVGGDGSARSGGDDGTNGVHERVPRADSPKSDFEVEEIDGISIVCFSHSAVRTLDERSLTEPVDEDCYVFTLA